LRPDVPKNSGVPDLHYTRQKFSAGVTMLATHPGRINERLYRAYEEALRFGHLDDIEHVELALDIEVFHRWVTEQSRVGNRGSTILAMSEEEAGEAAKEAVDLEARIRDALEARGEGSVRSQPEIFAAKQPPSRRPPSS